MRRICCSSFSIRPRGGPVPGSLARRTLEHVLGDPKVRLVVVEGPAGCGKTHHASRAAARHLLASPRTGQVFVVRPTVPISGESLGFLPGDLSEKMSPWTRPVTDALGRAFGSERPIGGGIVGTPRVELLPLAHIRGMDMREAFVVADEMQNSTPKQMQALLTRLGDGSRMVVAGDVAQSDLPVGSDGLTDLLRRLECTRKGREMSEAGIVAVVRLGRDDVIRGEGFVAAALDLYDDTCTENVNAGGGRI